MTNPQHDNFDWLPPLRAPRKPKVRRVIDDSWKPRYEAAYRKNFRERNPQAFKDHGYIDTTFPDVSKSNGLTLAVIKFLLWEGHRATRVSSVGRMIGKPGKQRFIPGTTRKGAADCSSTINARSVMWEIKVGNDQPSEYQLREQALERKAGGEYFFTHTMIEFFEQYDSL